MADHGTVAIFTPPATIFAGPLVYAFGPTLSYGTLIILDPVEYSDPIDAYLLAGTLPPVECPECPECPDCPELPSGIIWPPDGIRRGVAA